MFNTNAQCYQNISQVLLTSAFILWPTCMRGFGIREKNRCGLRFFGVFLCGFAVFGPPLTPPSVIYQAIIKHRDNNTSETYIRKRLQDKYRNHTASFHHKKHRNSTELSKHIWTLKDKIIDYFISWHIISSSSTYNSSSKRCNLCLEERFLTICRPDLSSLNKRIEIIPLAATGTKHCYITTKHSLI